MRFKLKISYGVLALVFLSVHYGMTAIYARYLSAGSELFEQWYLRFGIATVFALVLFRGRLRFKHMLQMPKRDAWLLLLRVITGGIIAVGLYTLAAQNAKIGPVAFMQAVPFLAVLGVLMFGDSINRQKILAVVVSFIGVVIVAVESFSDVFSFNVGEIYSLISIIFFAFTFLSRRWHTKHLNNFEITFGMLGLGFISNYILSLLLYHRAFPVGIAWTPMFTFVLVLAGFMATAAIFLQNYGFEHVGGVVAGSILNLEQVFGPIFGFIIYSEVLSLRELLGGVVIIGAAIAMNKLDAKPDTVPKIE